MALVAVVLVKSKCLGSVCRWKAQSESPAVAVEVLQSGISTAWVDAPQKRSCGACAGADRPQQPGRDRCCSFLFFPMWDGASGTSSLTAACALVPLCGITSESPAAAAAFPLCSVPVCGLNL